jgi:hypothetical protein
VSTASGDSPMSFDPTYAECVAPMKYVTPLNDAESETLHPRHAPHSSRRARRRAHRLWLSHQHSTIPPIARLSQVDQRRVAAWMARWQAGGSSG